MNKLKVLIANDYPVLKAGLKSIISGIRGFAVKAEAENGIEAIMMAKEKKPDIVILDSTLSLVSCFDAIGMIKKNNPKIKILFLTYESSEEYVFGALRAGASGVVYINTNQEELKSALKSISRGFRFLSKSLSEMIIEKLKKSNIEPTPTRWDDFFTKREREILFHLGEGMSSQEIARMLNISPRTVDTHKTNLIQKLHFSSGSMLKKFAVENRISKK